MVAKPKQNKGFSLKDELFNRNRVEYLADLLHTADAQFDTSGFVGDTLRQFKTLELKERISRIANALESYLPGDYRLAAKQITDALPPPLDPNKTDDDFGDFIFAPLGEYVARNGMQKKHLRLSLRTLKTLTQRFSMEYSIREFIETHREETLQELGKWSTDKNYHVRRLVSEGTRPLLPWAGRLSIAPAAPLPFLEVLHADPTRYVTRSVANHLNDISKTHPQLVVDTLKRWKQQGLQETSELQWMSKHALRTLVKQGNRQALQFLGFRPTPQIKVTDFSLNSTTLRPGQAIEFSFTLTAHRQESLMIDYVIDYVKAKGTLAPKVYKLKTMVIQNGEAIVVKKRHVLRAAATTYTLYPGTHHVTLQINGKPFGTQSFELSGL